MGQIIRTENIRSIFKVSSTTVSWPSNSIINIGGQQYSTMTNYLVNVATTGLGGLDTGTVGNTRTYFVFAVVSAGILGLVASLDPLTPLGFSIYKLIGNFTTDSSGLIIGASRDVYRSQSGSTTAITPGPIADFPELTVTAYSDGSPLWVGLDYDENGNYLNTDSIRFIVGSGGITDGYFLIYRNNVLVKSSYVINRSTTGFADISLPASSFSFIDPNPPVGLVTYKVSAQALNGSANIASAFLKVHPVSGNITAGNVVNIGANIPGPINELWARSFASYGSAGSNKVVRWGSIQTNLGSAVSYVSDSVNGDYFLINEIGLYAITSSLAYTSASNQHGITLNEVPADYTTTVNALGTKVLAMTTASTTTTSSEANAITNLNAGDKIRVHSDGGSSDGLATQNFLRITKIANLAGTGGVPAPGPRSEIRLSSGNGHGSTNTAVRRYSNILVNTGTAITYTDSPTLGGYFTINEEGLYAIDRTDRHESGSNVELYITKNDITINDSAILTEGSTLSAYAGHCGTTAYLIPGDVIRALGSSENNTGIASRFNIIKVNN